VLGRVELWTVDNVIHHDFEPGYPATLGVEWDYSLVKFAGSHLPLGTSSVELRAFDAAGNQAIESFAITVDGQAPSVQILAPLDGATVSGSFQVVLTASDPEGGPVWIELSVSGTPAATATGPDATITLDASELAPGSHVLSAVASDQAGNQSAPAAVGIQVP
jgi:hypothetical protein